MPLRSLLAPVAANGAGPRARRCVTHLGAKHWRLHAKGACGCRGAIPRSEVPAQGEVARQSGRAVLGGQWPVGVSVVAAYAEEGAGRERGIVAG